MEKSFNVLAEGERLAKGWEPYYDFSWRLRGHLVESMIAEGETSLPRVLALCERFDRTHKTLMSREDDTFTGEARFVPEPVPDGGWGLERLEAPVQGIVRGGAVTLPAYVHFDLAGMLAEFSDGCDAVVELGSGYGLQLFRTYFAGGARNADYIGAELSPAGRALADRLAALEPDLAFRSRAFDLNRPDFDFLAGYRRVLLFSVWSLMYLRTTPPDFFDALAALPGEVTCVFCEPFGSQVSASDGMGAEQADALGGGGLNRDFYTRFVHAAGRGQIEPLHVGKDLFSSGQHALAALTVLVGRKSATA